MSKRTVLTKQANRIFGRLSFRLIPVSVLVLLCALLSGFTIAAPNSVPGQHSIPGQSTHTESSDQSTTDSARTQQSGGQTTLSTGHLEGDWRYIVKPTDSVWSISKDFLTDGKNWLDLVRYNHFQSPKDITPGTAVNIPIAWLKIQPAPAIAISVTGEALLKRSNTSNWGQLGRLQYLHVGDTIRTLKGSVLIRFADDSVLRLEEHGTLIFNRLSQFGKSGMTDTGLRLEKGRVSTKVNPMKVNGSRYEISTPSAVAAVRGTEFRVEVNKEGTLLEVTKGVVQLQSGTQRQSVQAGYSAQVDSRGKQHKPTPLLAPPKRLVTPPSVNQFPVRLAWQPVKGAAAYAYQIFSGVRGEEMVQQGNTSEPALTLQHLDNGEYTLYFMAVGANQTRSIADVQRIHVQVSAKSARPVSPADGAMIIDRQPIFRWTAQNPSQVTKLEVADSILFNPVIAETEWTYQNQQALDVLLPPGQYFWRLTTRAGPRETAKSQTAAFQLMKTLPLPQILSVNYSGEMAKVFWKRIPNAASYTVQLARESQFTQLDKTLETQETNVSIKLEPNVLYFLRIQASPKKYYQASVSDPIQLELTH